MRGRLHHPGDPSAVAVFLSIQYMTGRLIWQVLWRQQAGRGRTALNHCAESTPLRGLPAESAEEGSALSGSNIAGNGHLLGNQWCACARCGGSDTAAAIRERVAARWSRKLSRASRCWRKQDYYIQAVRLYGMLIAAKARAQMPLTRDSRRCVLVVEQTLRDSGGPQHTAIALVHADHRPRAFWDGVGNCLAPDGGPRRAGARHR
jgi:hypothetical protein